MPAKILVLNILTIILQYSVVLLIYVFLFYTIKIIYRDLKSSPIKVNDQQPASHDHQRPARLIVVDSHQLKLAHDAFNLTDAISIGRDEHNDIVITDTFVSHEHACITEYKKGYWLADLNSTNGTFLNDRQIKEEVLLADGDYIKIGAVTFRFER